MRILKRFLKMSLMFFVLSLFLSNWGSKSISQAKVRAIKVPEHQNAKYLELRLFYDYGFISVENVTIRDGYLPERLEKKNGWYRVEIRDLDEELLYSTSFFDPRIRFYDEFDPSTKKLSGGFILKDQVFFVLRVPILKENQKITIADPQERIVWQDNLADLYKKITVTKPAFLWESETIIYNGDPENRIDLVFLGDGYTINDTGIFRTDVIRDINYLFSISPYDEYYSYFNVHMVQVISAESGVDHPEADPPIWRNTALGAYYNCAGIPRLVCANDNLVYDAASSTIPYWDKILLLVNDPVYGGSGGDIAIAYNGWPYWGRQVMNHEFGHSFGYLLDEYLYGSTPGSVSGCNCDTDSLNPKWQAWIDIGSPGVNAFRGCSWLNYVRPTFNECTMNGLQDRFCVVCTEQLAKSVNWRILSFDDYYPTEDPTIQTSVPQIFWIEKLTPSTHDLKVQWYVDDVPQEGETQDSFSFVSEVPGFFEVKVALMDSTDLVLSDPDNYLIDLLSWNVDVVHLTYIPGDVNADDKVNLSDVIYLANYYLKGGLAPIPLEAGNIDCENGINLGDVIYLANYLLKGGPAPEVCPAESDTFWTDDFSDGNYDTNWTWEPSGNTSAQVINGELVLLTLGVPYDDAWIYTTGDPAHQREGDKYAVYYSTKMVGSGTPASLINIKDDGIVQWLVNIYPDNEAIYLMKAIIPGAAQYITWVTGLTKIQKGVKLKVRVQVMVDTIRVKVWTGPFEPDSWDLEYDSAYTTEPLWPGVYVGGWWLNNDTLSFDDFVVVNLDPTAQRWSSSAGVLDKRVDMNKFRPFKSRILMSK